MHFNQMTDPEIQLEIGRRLKALRLQINIDLDTAASWSGVSKATIKRVEAGRNFGLDNLIALMRSYNQVDRLGLLLPEPLIIDGNTKERKRASRRQHH